MKGVCFTSLALAALLQVAGCPYFAEDTVPAARVTTTLGEFVIELDPDQAPATVANFAQYVMDDFYDGTLFHRVVAGSLVHGGGYIRGLLLKETRDPISSEADNGLSNVRGSVAMARTDDPDSATAQFYVNLKDNLNLDADDERPGYAVFGQVVAGLEVVDAIGAAATGQRQGMTDVPVADVVIRQVQRTQRSVAGQTVPAARVVTSLGEFVIALNPDRAPITVQNFLQYVDDGFYAGTLFHRVVADFVIQGGGYTLGLVEKQAGTPVANESQNGLRNVRRAVALHYADDPDSATAQFIIHLADHPDLDATADAPGLTVFGRVVYGMDVVDRLAAVPTQQQGDLTGVPVADVVIEDIELFDQPTGRMAVTPEGEAYFANQQYQALVLLRRTLIEAIGLLASRD
jgi:cyclophilin family peptidyl-prolyl cis-trans isomerase